MVLLRTRIVVLLAVAGAAVAAVAAQVNNSPWPPGVQKVSESSPPLPPDQAMKTFFMPPGYHVELVASEPLVQDPIVIDFDADGRMWVVEMTTLQPDDDLAAINERAPECRVVVLEDTNDDGRVDKRTVFVDGLVAPARAQGARPRRAVGEPPNLWFVRDTNWRSHRPTRKELVTDTYGRADGNPEHNANSLFWAMDNWIYTSEHDGYLRLKNGKFETAPTLSRGQWGASQDDVGRVYRNTNSDALFVDLIAAALLHAQSDAGADARSVRVAGDDERQHRVAGSADAGRESRLPDGYPARGRHAARSTPRSARRPSIAATGSRRSCTATCSSPSRPAISSGG